MNGEEYKLSAYANDTNITLRNSRSIGEVFQIYGRYTEASGAILKPEKKLSLIGSFRLERVPD